MNVMQSRRHFLASLSAAGVAGVVGSRATGAEERPPETTVVRLSKIPGICIAPQYVAEALLAAEGFKDVQYVDLPAAIQHAALARGEIDFSLHFAAPLVIPLDAGEPITVLAGVHPGCFEVFGNEHVRSITDLKGKRVGVQALGSSPHVFLTSIAAYIGLDPANDIDWVTTAPVKPMALFADGQIDDREKKFLRDLKSAARRTSPEFQVLYGECMN